MKDDPAAERLFPPQPKKLSLFNHEKRLGDLEGKAGDFKKCIADLTPNRFDSLVQRWGAVCGLFAFIVILVLWICPTLR